MPTWPAECDEYRVPHHVLLTDARLADELVASLREAGTPAHKRGHRVIVGDGAVSEPEGRLELLFFLRTWALTRPGVAFEVVDKGAETR